MYLPEVFDAQDYNKLATSTQNNFTVKRRPEGKLAPIGMTLNEDEGDFEPQVNKVTKKVGLGKKHGLLAPINFNNL